MCCFHRFEIHYKYTNAHCCIEFLLQNLSKLDSLPCYSVKEFSVKKEKKKIKRLSTFHQKPNFRNTFLPIKPHIKKTKTETRKLQKYNAKSQSKAATIWMLLLY